MSPDHAARRELHVVAAGPLTTTQDEGRLGYAALGVSPSGAADRSAYRLGNRLLGNPAGTASLEMTLGGLTVRGSHGMWVVLTGALTPWRIDGQDQAMHAPVFVDAGSLVTVGRPTRGLRTYLSVRGGIDAVRVLGSRSWDVLGEIGPRPLRPGEILPLGPAPVGDLPAVDVVVPSPHSQSLTVLAGPRADWIEGGVASLAGEYGVRVESNRVAVRFDGPALHRADRGADRGADRELPSEPLIAGAVQVPPDGQPVIFLADHPTTGGYPVVGVVVEADLPVLAQLRPGERVRLEIG